MSLINDALKRAKEAQPATTPTLEPQQPMQPVEPQPETACSKALPPYFLPAVLIVLSGACWFLIKGWEAKRQAGLYPTPIVVQAREAAADAENATETQSLAPAPANPSTLSGSNSADVAQTRTTEPTPEGASPLPPTFKLQGIFFRPSNPSAVVNTKTVFVGDFINDAKVTSIDRQSVTLVYEGQTKVLTLQ